MTANPNLPQESNAVTSTLHDQAKELTAEILRRISGYNAVIDQTTEEIISRTKQNANHSRAV